MGIRYALRMLAKTPGFTLVAVLTLALGIGINTTVFTLYESVAWKPLAVRAPAEMLRLIGQSEDARIIDEFSYPEFEQLRGSARSFSSMIASSVPQALLCLVPDEGAGKVEVLSARLVSADYFEALGVTPVLGRAFGAHDRAVAVLSHPFWQQRMHADPSVLGKTLLVQGTAFTILGVAPEKFAATGLPPLAPDLWIPLSMQTAVLPGVDWLHDAAARRWHILGRRKPGVSVAQASAELDVLGRSLPRAEDRPMRLRGKQATLFQTDTGEFQSFATVSVLLMGAVALILLIGCVNLVNLLLARNASRQNEIAVRLALGAGRMRLVRLLATESALLGLLGGAVGLLVSLWSCEWIRVWITGALARIGGAALGISLDIAPDWRVFSYTAAMSAVTGMAVGLWPALRAAGMDVQRALKQESGASRGRWRGRSLLLTAQVAACLILLAGAGVLFRGVWRAGAADPGFDAKHILLMAIDPRALAPTPAARTALLREVIRRVDALPEVAALTWTDRAPFLGHGSGSFRNGEGARANCLFASVSDGYFQTLGIPVLAGRTFSTHEVERDEPVAIVSESAARRLWPGRDPIGRRIPIDPWLRRNVHHDTVTVIGVVKSVRSTYLSKMDSGFIYFPKPLPNGFMTVLARTRSAPRAAFRPAFAALSAVHPNLPSQTLLVGLEDGPMQLQKLMEETPALVASMLGLLALVLASVGISGLVAYLVAQRTREIGIHFALGAQKRDVVRMVLRQTLRPVIWGGGIGLAGALGMSCLLASLIVMPDVPDLTYGAGPFDLLTFAGILAVLAAVVVAASFVPLRRATRIEPAVALRNE